MVDLKKKHFFGDCTGFYWRQSREEREPYLVKDVREITCGQCKGRILDVIRKSDWSLLNDSEFQTLTVAASCVK